MPTSDILSIAIAFKCDPAYLFLIAGALIAMRFYLMVRRPKSGGSPDKGREPGGNKSKWQGYKDAYHGE